MESKLSSQDMDRIIELYGRGIPSTKIAKELGVSRTPIMTCLRTNNIKIRTITDYRIYSINDHIFSNLESEISAYLLGFITADGSVKSTQLSVSLSIKDYDHLQKIRYALGSNAKFEFRKDKKDVRIRINSPHIIKDLQKYGVGERKSAIVLWPENLPEFSYRYYLRGVIDGDGCFSVAHYKYNIPYIRCEIVSGSEKYLYGLQNYLQNNIGFPKGSMGKSTNSECWYLRYHGTELAQQLYHYLYDNSSLFMDRKRTKLKDLLFINGVLV